MKAAGAEQSVACYNSGQYRLNRYCFKARLYSQEFLNILISLRSNSHQSLGNRNSGVAFCWDVVTVTKSDGEGLSLLTQVLLNANGKRPSTNLFMNWCLKNLIKDSRGKISIRLHKGAVWELYLLEVIKQRADFCFVISSFKLPGVVELQMWIP